MDAGGGASVPAVPSSARGCSRLTRASPCTRNGRVHACTRPFSERRTACGRAWNASTGDG
eukprot:scaffold171_cov229-Prasinococcus_capsulatus_cf.AAC.1